jgi:hypothetical protein
MLQGRDSSLIDKCNCVGPIFLEGVDRLDDWWDRILAQDPVFVLLGVHSTILDDAQTNINDVTVIHWVVYSAGVCVFLASGYEWGAVMHEIPISSPPS